MKSDTYEQRSGKHKCLLYLWTPVQKKKNYSFSCLHQGLTSLYKKASDCLVSTKEFNLFSLRAPSIDFFSAPDCFHKFISYIEIYLYCQVENFDTHQVDDPQNSLFPLFPNYHHLNLDFQFGNIDFYFLESIILN